MINYPETKDLPSYIPGYEAYCDEMEQSNNRNYSDSFTEEDDRKYDEYRIQEAINGKQNL